MNSKRVAAALLGLAIGMAWIGAGSADLHADRKAAMRHMGRALHVLSQMLTDNAFDAAEATKRGTDIATTLQQMKDLFPAGSEHADDRSLGNIWTDRAGFEAARTNAYDAAIILGKSSEAAAFQGALTNLARTCKACHDKFADLSAP